MASLGIGSNPEYKYLNLKKAGVSRALGIRPTVRGVAMILVIIHMVVVKVKNLV